MHGSLLTKRRFQSLLKSASKPVFLLLAIIAGLTSETFAQPANDDPCNAIPLTPDAVCTYTVFTTVGATATSGVPAPGCANYSGGDVWFTITVPAASNGTIKFDSQAGTLTDMGMAIYRGDCTNLQLVECNDDAGAGLMSQITLNSLTVGAQLWIRVWEYGNDDPGDFGICVKYPGPPPTYDEPCTATALPAVTTTCSYTTFTNEGATGSTIADPGCADYQGKDVWFSVVVPAGGTLKFDTQTGEMTDGGMAIYSGTCASPTLIACDADNSPNGLMPQIQASNLTPGETILIRVWSEGTSTTNVGTFGICVSIPPPPPPNDDPCNAIVLTASPTCTYATFSTASASASTGVPAPGCANYQGGDVWFQVEVPCEGSLLIDTQTGVITDGGMAVYRGACGNLQLIDCNDDGSPNGLMPQLSLTSLTPGSTIWIRVWEYGNDNPGTFGICVSIPPPPPPGSVCFGAQPFCSSNTYTYPNTTNVPSLGGGGIYDCLGTTPNPAWYYMQLQTGGSMSIFIQQTSTTGNIVDVDYALWGPFPTLASSCNGLSASNVVSCSYSTSGTETATITNGQAGDYYILLITNFANVPGTVTFNQNGGTGSTSCDIVCTLTSANSGPVCGGTTFNLTSSTVVGATYEWVGPNCFTSTQQNPTGVIAPTIPGSYVYTVTATTPSGTACTSYDTVIVSAAPVLGADTTLYACSGSTVDLSPLYNVAGLTTSGWTFGGTPVANLAAVAVGGVYQFVGTNAAGCADTALATVVIDTVRSTITSTGNASCTVPGQITITNPSGVGGVFEYSIDSDPGVFQTSNIFTAVPGTYTITTRDSIGCTVTGTVTVDFTNDLTLSVSADTAICQGQSVTLTATSTAASYVWSPATGLSTTIGATTVATPSDSTTYTVIATLGACADTATVTIRVDKNLSVDAGGPLFVDAGGTAQVAAIVTGANTDLTSILWTPSQGLSASNILNPAVTATGATGSTTYNITVTNTAGCSATDDLLVNIIPNCRNVRNSFTPNGDGNNERWLVYDEYSCLKNVTVHVFNRYGSKVYESRDYRNTWDGRYKNKPVPDGTYYAVIDFTLLTGRVVTVRTDVTILR